MMGFLKGRRREDAMAAVSVAAARLRRVGAATVDSFHDMSNAFASTNRQALIDCSLPLVGERDRQLLLLQRIVNSACSLPAVDGTYGFVPQEGAFMGTSEAPRCFLATVRVPLFEWSVEAYPTVRQMVMECGVFEGIKCDGSLVSFADDIARKLVIQGGAAVGAIEEAMENATSLSGHVGGIGLEQNMKKLEFVVRLRNGRENRAFAAHFALHPHRGRALPHARHLGGRFVWNGSTYHEIKMRLRTTKGAWAVGRCRQRAYRLVGS